MEEKKGPRVEPATRKWVEDRLRAGWSPEHIMEVAARFDHHAGQVAKVLEARKLEKPKPRPVGVSIVGYIIIAVGVFRIVFSGFVGFLGVVDLSLSLNLGVGIFYLAIGGAVLRGRKWAYYAALVVAALAIAISLFRFSLSLDVIINLVLAISIFALLEIDEVKKYFSL